MLPKLILKNELLCVETLKQSNKQTKLSKLQLHLQSGDCKNTKIQYTT